MSPEITAIGVLDIESVSTEDTNEEVAPTLYRPRGTVLLNDGVSYHWMCSSETYDLAHDGVGWVVTCRTWPTDGHIRRLANVDLAFVESLPLLDGVHVLDRAKDYTLVPSGAFAWVLAD